MTDQIDATKYGGRHSKQDRNDIRELRRKANEMIDISKRLEPTDDDDKNEERMTSAKGADIPTEETPVIYGFIKTAGVWELDVLGVPFGGPNNGKDSDNEYFSTNTKTWNELYPTPPAVYYHGFSPDGKPMGEPAIIGTIKRIWQDGKGWWYRVVLDRSNDLAKRIWEAAKRGIARASSGSIAHMVRKARDGEILNWPVVELSLIDAEGKRQPANQYAVALPAAKALYAKLEMDLPEAEPEGEEITGEAAQDLDGIYIVDKDGERWLLKNYLSKN